MKTALTAATSVVLEHFSFEQPIVITITFSAKLSPKNFVRCLTAPISAFSTHFLDDIYDGVQYVNKCCAYRYFVLAADSLSDIILRTTSNFSS